MANRGANRDRVGKLLSSGANTFKTVVQDGEAIYCTYDLVDRLTDEVWE